MAALAFGTADTLPGDAADAVGTASANAATLDDTASSATTCRALALILVMRNIRVPNMSNTTLPWVAVIDYSASDTAQDTAVLGHSLL
jgi:hypothetical protein